jgi:hypothetical protein
MITGAIAAFLLVAGSWMVPAPAAGADAVNASTEVAPAVDAGAGGASDAGTPADGGSGPEAGVSGTAKPNAPEGLTPVATLPRVRVGGRIFARGSRRPVAGAHVTADLDGETDSDEEGRFQLELPCGRHHLAVQVPGFDPITVTRDPCVEQAPFVLRLTPRSGAESYETVVRVPTGHQEMRLEGRELLHTPGTLGDPFRAIESLPGVTSVAWPAPIYAVRGSNPGNTGFFLDDLRVPALFHLAFGPSVIHPYFFQDLDFFAGGYPARYGRYVAGIVAARTRTAPEDDVHASVDARLFDAGAMVTAPLPGQGSVAAAARYSYTGAIINYLSDAGVKLGYWDYQLRADRSFGAVRLTLLAFGSDDRLVTQTHTIALRFHRVKLRAEAALWGGLLSASLAVGQDRTEAPLAETVPITISAASLIPRLAYIRRTARVDLEAGVDGEIERLEPVAMLDRIGVLDLGKRRTARLFAGYVSVTARAGSRLVLTPEVRVDTYAVSGATRTDLGPRLAARFAFDEATWLKLSGGRFSQLPSLPLQVPGAENFGLAVYGLQRSWQGALSAGTTRAAGLESSVTLYVQRYRLTDLRDPAVSRHSDPFADDFLVPRDALSYGLELLVRRPATERLHGWLSYTLSSNQRALGGGAIGPSDWDQRHVVNLVIGYQWRATTFGGRVHFNTGRPVLVDGSGGETFMRLPSFFQIDLRCDHRFLLDKFTIDAYVELVNATLSRQVTGLRQTALDQPLTEDGFRIVLPTVGLHGEF